MFDGLLLLILYPIDLAVIVVKWAWLFGNVLDNVILEILDLKAKSGGAQQGGPGGPRPPLILGPGPLKFPRPPLDLAPAPKVSPIDFGS